MDNSFKAVIGSMIVETPDQRMQRVCRLMSMLDVNSAEATVIAQATLEAVVNALAAVGSAVDSLPKELQISALPYLMRATIVNMDQTENALIMMLTEQAMEAGLEITVINADGECRCPACTARREQLQGKPSNVVLH